MEALFTVTVSIARYNVVKDPFGKPFGKKSKLFIKKILPLTLTFLIFIVIFVRYEGEGLTFLSSPLFILLGKTDKSVTQKLVTIITSVYLIIIQTVTLIFSFKLLNLNSKSNAVLDEVKKRERKQTMTRNIILAGTTNVICWIPFSVFYLVSVFLDNFPVLVLYWMTLVVLPINSMLNPIIFNLSDIKSKMKKIKETKNCSCKGTGQKDVKNN